ncbi:MAG: hypothetical protein RLZZ31_2048 [Actinomycetota bacterium]|jgi:hypothetical protein
MKFAKRIAPAILALIAGLGILRWLDRPQQISSDANADGKAEIGDQSTSPDCRNELRFLEGKKIETRFGPVQVIGSVTSNGLLCSVTAVNYPTSDRRSESISRTSLPLLNVAALEVSSANFDAISGATYTSDGYKESLQSLLDQQ